MPERRTQKVRFRKHCKDRSSLLSNDYSNDKKTEGKTISLSFSLSLDKHQTDTGGTGRAARHTMNDSFCLISLVLCVCLTFLFLLTATLLKSLRINITVKGFFVWFSFSSLRIMSKTDLCVTTTDTVSVEDYCFPTISEHFRLRVYVWMWLLYMCMYYMRALWKCDGGRGVESCTGADTADCRQHFLRTAAALLCFLCCYCCCDQCLPVLPFALAANACTLCSSGREVMGSNRRRCCSVIISLPLWTPYDVSEVNCPH